MTNIEQAGDVVDRNLMGLASKSLKRGLSLSKEGKSELLGLAERLVANARQAGSLFMTGDMRAARLLANEKLIFRDREADATALAFRPVALGPGRNGRDECSPPRSAQGPQAGQFASRGRRGLSGA